VNIRLANSADCSAIANLHIESWRNAYRGMFSDKYLDEDIFAERRRLWAERFQNPTPTQHIIVGEDDSNIRNGPTANLIGFACAFAHEDPRWGSYLDNLHVLPSLKRQGIGARLTGHIAAWCAQTSPQEGMHLYVLEQNLNARKFYERIGGVVVEELVWLSPDGGNLKSLRYAWSDLAPLIALR
jgi:ribosomal protein S18 acetylase RimI-like enzyme